jgi:hypothetical protein
MPVSATYEEIADANSSLRTEVFTIQFLFSYLFAVGLVADGALGSKNRITRRCEIFARGSARHY